ncbi:hypothetical protein C8R45DRAFT_1013270 [Mycena sanguinolenta]|nr:hypothetical protein C8R45DRAFT_1013270 [Mycena sanguinolenta]
MRFLLVAALHSALIGVASAAALHFTIDFIDGEIQPLDALHLKGHSIGKASCGVDGYRCQSDASCCCVVIPER